MALNAVREGPTDTTVFFQALTVLPELQSYSFEEIRLHNLEALFRRDTSESFHEAPVITEGSTPISKAVSFQDPMPEALNAVRDEAANTTFFFQSLTVRPEFQAYSFEEIRFHDLESQHPENLTVHFYPTPVLSSITSTGPSSSSKVITTATIPSKWDHPWSISKVTSSGNPWLANLPPFAPDTGTFVTKEPSNPIPTLAMSMNHPKFYFTDMHTNFMAESTVFRLHGALFARLSPATHALVARAQSESIVVLEGVTAQDFARFLEVVYYPCYEDPLALFRTRQEWESVSALSVRWECTQILKLVHRALDHLSTPAS